MHAPGRVPGRTGCQFTLFEQQHIGPTDLGQVVERAGADDSAANDHCPGARLHVTGAPGNWVNAVAATAVSPNGAAVCVSHSEKWRAVVEGVSRNTPDDSATRFAATCAMTVAAARPAGNTLGCRSSRQPRASASRHEAPSSHNAASAEDRSTVAA